MVRKVGFGDEEKTPAEASSKMSVADQAMERFRARARAEKTREDTAKRANKGAFKKVFFLVFWLILWVAMSGAMIYTMLKDGVANNVLPFILVTGASVFVVSRVLTRILKIATGRTVETNREDHQ